VIIDYSESDSVFSRLSHKSAPIINGIQQDDQKKIRTYYVASEKSQPVAKIEKGSIDINRANEKELKKLPRIGPAMASRIVEHRNTKGPFKSIDDLILVKGIGKKTFKLIKFIIILVI
jgi:competence protein ComEA